MDLMAKLSRGTSYVKVRGKWKLNLDRIFTMVYKLKKEREE